MTSTRQRKPADTRVLLVEDESFMRELIVHALRSVDYRQILEAEDGSAALRALESQAVDIVISDIEMQPINGFELVRHIRSGETRLPREIPVIFLTGLSDLGTLSSAAQLVIQGFLVKPVSANLLAERIVSAQSKPVELHPAEVYRSMSLEANDPTSDTARSRTNTASQVPKAPTASGPASTRGRSLPSLAADHVDVLMLEAGMQLRSDVYARGVLLLTAGTLLLDAHVQVLQDMRTLLDSRQIAIVPSDQD